MFTKFVDKAATFVQDYDSLDSDKNDDDDEDDDDDTKT